MTGIRRGIIRNHPTDNAGVDVIRINAPSGVLCATYGTNRRKHKRIARRACRQISNNIIAGLKIITQNTDGRRTRINRCLHD